MRDLTIRWQPRLAGLAEVAESLGRAGVSVEGGGMWAVNGREVLVQRLDQERAGELGRITRRMAEAGVTIEVLYSDHQNQLILGVDDLERGRAVSAAWTAERSQR